MEDKALVINGDCLEILKELPDSSVESLITDPPAGISFMGKAWDDDKGGRKQWIAWMSEVMSECIRVMKPGAHGFVWALPRTSHWTATALEDAGFEIRDVVTHLFGSGFPKSLNVGKLVKEFEGWGTALKPASEHWILVRKPCAEKTVAANVLKHGTGGINIDASRIRTNEDTSRVTNAAMRGNNFVSGRTEKGPIGGGHAQGRFPANLVLSHNDDCVEVVTEAVSAWECTPGCAVVMLDEQRGNLGESAGGNDRFRDGHHYKDSGPGKPCGFGDSSGASRFFYCAKASKKDKNAGLEGMPEKQVRSAGGTTSSGKPTMEGRDRFGSMQQNTHPTVKSSTLMSYLIKLITPPNGIVLDPFMGSGSTGVAAKREGFKFIGIEKEPEYFQIAEKRISA